MLTGKPQARFGFDISLYASVEVLVDIHPLVQYAHHINQVGAGNPVVQRVRSNSVLAVAGADFIAGPSDPRIGHDTFDRTLDFAQVFLGLIVVPALRAVIPDLFQVGACGG